MIPALLFAFQICWTAPTENVDGTPVVVFNEDGEQIAGLSHATVYYGDLQAGQWSRTLRVDTDTDHCENIRASRGVWYAAVSVTNWRGSTSALSNWVTKEENRLRGPSGGRLLGPSGGRVLTD